MPSKRPFSSISSQQQQAGAFSRKNKKKKAKLTTAPPSRPLTADVYAQLAQKGVLGEDKPAIVPPRATHHKPAQEEGVKAVAAPFVVISPLRDELTSEEGPAIDAAHADDELRMHESSESRAASPSLLLSSPLPVLSRQRASLPSLHLHHLQFLLFAAHALAPTAPSTAQHLIRTMRDLSDEHAIQLSAEVRSRFCVHCSVLLLPGLNCTWRTKLDKSGTERWIRKQQRKKRKKARHRQVEPIEPQAAAEERREGSEGSTMTVEEGKKARLTRKETKRAERQRQVALRAAAIEPVRLVRRVVICGECGQESEVDGSGVKKGGRHAEDARSWTGEALTAKQRSTQKRQAKAHAQGGPAAAGDATRALKPDVEEKRAEKRRKQLQQQQALTKQGKAAAAPAASPSDAFAGSLFFRFQKPSKQGSVTDSATLPGVVAVGEASFSLPPSSSRPFSFVHPSASTAPSGPLTPARPASQPMTLLEAAAKRMKDEARALKRQSKPADTSPAPAPPTPAAAHPAPPAPASAGLYSLLQSFSQ